MPTTERDLLRALEQMRRIGYRPMALHEHRDLKPLLELAVLGGPSLPAGYSEVRERVEAARDLIRKVIPRLHDLDDADLSELTNPAGADERPRLEDAATLIFQLNRAKPLPKDAQPTWETLEREASEFWGNKNRWFGRQRHDFLLEKLAGWILEEDRRHVEDTAPRTVGESGEEAAESHDEGPHPQPGDPQPDPLTFARIPEPVHASPTPQPAGEKVLEPESETATAGWTERPSPEPDAPQLPLWFIAVTVFSSVVLLGSAVILLVRGVS